jgi:hypothetical protein
MGRACIPGPYLTHFWASGILEKTGQGNRQAELLS